MAKSFRNLTAKMSPHARQAADEKVNALKSEMPLQELRQARKLSQEQLAERLHLKQANISRLERRTDMYISTLRNYIEAMGGQLDIVAKFPEGEIHIKQFEETVGN
jgi:ribosome-binding protein aMBF1 (putative translation factor)